MSIELERLPASEMERRIECCRTLMRRFAPEAGGMLVCSRISIYYLTGTLGVGLVWVPIEGEPVLMVRKGLERARKESPLRTVFAFRSYRDVTALCAEAGSPLTSVLAVDKNSFSWSMAEMLRDKLGKADFVSCDAVLSHAKSIKSAWEMDKMRAAGDGLRRTLDEQLPARIHAGMTELEIAHAYVAAAWECGNSGLLRMNAHGEESYVGSVSAGDSGNHPTYYNGPLGYLGLHPAVPFMGNAGRIWEKNMLLSTDLSFSFEGYHSDRTQTYWTGGPIPDSVARPHQVCADIFLRVVERLRPGVTPGELWLFSCTLAEKSGYAEGFMGLGRDKVAFLGHGVGLTLDEYPAFARGFDEPLEEGMVVAIEPKIGLPGIGMVGVEHSLEITATGACSLTGDSTHIITIE